MPLPRLELGVADDATPETGHTEVSDITLLRGMPLVFVGLNGKENPDLSVLVDCPSLESLVLLPQARNMDVLRKLPNLKRISIGWPGGSAKMLDPEAFWKEYDAKQAAGKK